MPRCILAIVLLPCLLISCARHAPSPKRKSSADASNQPPRRIVTLAPALTQMVVDLGLGDQLVGVAQHDAAAPPPPAPALPVVGSFVHIDTERLLSLHPTHVLMMVASRGVPDSLAQLARSAHFKLVAWRYPKTIEDVGDILAGTADKPGLGAVLGEPDAAQQLRQQMFDDLKRLGALTDTEKKPRVLMVIGLHPLMASGPGTVNDQLLAYAGGINAAAGASVTAPTYDHEALLAINPQVILLLRPGSPPLRGPDDPRLAAFQGLPIDAVKKHRIELLSDPLILLPSTSLPHAAGEMAKAIHPDLADRVDAAMNLK